MCVMAIWNRVHALMINLRTLNLSLFEEFDSVLRKDLDITNANSSDDRSHSDQEHDAEEPYDGIDKEACKMFGINLEMFESACQEFAQTAMQFQKWLSSSVDCLLTEARQVSSTLDELTMSPFT